MTELSVIIVSYNTRALLINCLESLRISIRNSALKSEVIVIDNASSDGSPDEVERKFPDVTLIRHDENSGFGRANNTGIARARGKLILLLNSDTVVGPETVAGLVRFSRTHPDCYVGPRLLNTDGTSQPSCGPFYSLPVVFAMLFLRGDRTGLTRYSPDKDRYVDWISGACIMAPRKLFADPYRFDEGIFMYMEEIELLYRARIQGYRCFYTVAATITHAGAASSPNGRMHAVVNIFRGLSYFYRKHYPYPARLMLKLMLIVKAGLGIGIGIITGRRSISETYAQALRVV
ncbi:hypothetical protein A2Z33_05635 [Candidatus Gottesmanbacteria bacterium RBG_16_52_11]|uniref:Glycosyltransferase 2-like domain-containing protein n=1 Tax=Candidatus Gottesmanbacteria bacterium RBG_16_52_11 TaxID=1798374 RepID=A0A1F5YP87_9BACT|nr:MAG: hypothetical protein A2Z33_05635 [Candidatus Gottesmanbacteria bacterium RBG_16_52_11]